MLTVLMKTILCPNPIFTLLRLLHPGSEVSSGFCPIATPSPRELVAVNEDSVINLFPSLVFIICSIRNGSSVRL